MPVETGYRPTALDRIAQGIVTVGESRRARAILSVQPVIYADFVRRGVAEGMPFIGAALHPFLIRLGGVDQIFTNPETANQMMFAIELAELNTIGIATTVAVGASALSRYSRVFHGELPVHDPDGVIFLAAGSSDLLADSFGEVLINRSGTQRPRNVYFSALYNQTDSRPTLPKKGFQRRHYIAAYDRRLKVTDSRELQLTGVFNAKTVVIATDSHQALEDIAITIHGHSHGQTRIIPVAVDPLNMHACEIDDINNGNRITLTDALLTLMSALQEW